MVRAEQERPRLSVVVPVLDERAYLPGLIASIEAQTLTPDEVVVVDGMSGDGTASGSGRPRPRDRGCGSWTTPTG